METIEIKAKDLYIEHMVDAMADYIKKQGYPELDAQKVQFANGRGAWWNGWYVSEGKMDVIARPFLALVARGKHETSPKGVVYRCMSGRDATFMIGDNIYYMSV